MAVLSLLALLMALLWGQKSVWGVLCLLFADERGLIHRVDIPWKTIQAEQ